MFSALADPVRLGILDALAGRAHSVNELVDRFPVSQPAVSRHLRILREAGLVRVEPAGKSRIYHLEPAPLQELDAWLGRYRHFWATRLDALESHMDADLDN